MRIRLENNTGNCTCRDTFKCQCPKDHKQDLSNHFPSPLFGIRFHRIHPMIISMQQLVPLWPCISLWSNVLLHHQTSTTELFWVHPAVQHSFSFASNIYTTNGSLPGIVNSHLDNLSLTQMTFFVLLRGRSGPQTITKHRTGYRLLDFVPKKICSTTVVRIPELVESPSVSHILKPGFHGQTQSFVWETV